MISQQCINPFYFMTLFFLSFFVWFYIVYFHLMTLPKIKKQEISIYNIIIANNRSWIERGYFLPSDMRIAWRLHRKIYNGSITLIEKDEVRKYKFSIKIFLILSSAGMLALILFLMCALPLVKIY